ncbi:hypothetical protein BDZ85DRAFT_261323 [Elsinoe ampelina]|uniref:Ca2+-modulated nonselective cation channel polycystin n=1 Tax=Elsinoe ampelina TaxID=302913 RepID=A0A6A6GC85_9PEZI|nr:hypothetical protein BDZ85DRAFT_261323 [Elsinoe ampelina]
MASPDVAAHSPDRHARRRPFASWMKKLTNLKGSDQQGKKTSHFKSKKPSINRLKGNNPYPESGHVQSRPAAADVDSANGSLAYSNRNSQPGRSSVGSTTRSEENGHVSHSNKSAAPTVATNPETVHSDAGHSKAFTAKTGGGFSSVDGAGRNSTFSSPNQSEQSLTTTLTTIQSTSPGIVLGQGGAGQTSANAGPPSVQFTHQFPPSGTASALPPHLAPTGHPSTYSAATANNLLTDDASILTLASSSKRRRRRSMDTDASVRALAPSSVWGGSRESLPLSVLSATAESTGQSLGQAQGRPSIGGVASAERASVYSSQGVAAPALVSDRNSYYAASLKQSVKDKDRDKDARSIDGRSMHRDADERSIQGGKSLHGGESIRGYEGSIRSGALGHMRNDSNPTNMSAPLASPGSAPPARVAADTMSRRSSNYRADGLDEDGDYEQAKRV